MVINRDKHNTYMTIAKGTSTFSSQQGNQSATSNDNSNQGTVNTTPTVIISAGGMTEEQSNKLDSIEEGAEVNQSAFSFITINGTEATIEAQEETDTFDISAGDNIVLTLKDNNIIISANSIKYLKDLLDVSTANASDEDLLIYNSNTEKWEATNPNFATIDWVNQQFDNIIGSTPDVLDTIQEVDTEITRLKARIQELETKLSKYEQLN